jgi:fructose-1,6-bisphosphatase I
MDDKLAEIRLSKWLDQVLPYDFPKKASLISIIEIIAESTIPIRGLLEKGITSREIQYRMNLTKIDEHKTNIYDEVQIHEDVLTHGIILKTLRDNKADVSFIASEEAEPFTSNGYFGISIDPVDGSSNVAVNRTVGTIVGIYNPTGHIICAFYVLYGIFTNLIIAIGNKVAEFILDTSPYSMSFYHYIFKELKAMPDVYKGGVRCMGGDSNVWSSKCKSYEDLLKELYFKDRYSGSFVGDFHAIIHYGGIYSYFPYPKPKLRVYYEWIPLGFIIRTLGGELYFLDCESGQEKIKNFETYKPLNKEYVREHHNLVSGGILGSKYIVNRFLEI